MVFLSDRFLGSISLPGLPKSFAQTIVVPFSIVKAKVKLACWEVETQIRGPCCVNQDVTFSYAQVEWACEQWECQVKHLSHPGRRHSARL